MPVVGEPYLVERPGDPTIWEVWDERRCLGRFIDHGYAVKFRTYARGHRPPPATGRP